jgi:hypothetical protein
MQRNWLEAPTMEVRQRAAAFGAFLDGHGHRLPDAAAMRLTAGRALAREALWRAARAYDHGRGADLGEELADFAFEVFPEAAALPEWRGLRWRRRLGTRLAPVAQPLMLPGLLRHRLQGWLWWRRWARHGV